MGADGVVLGSRLLCTPECMYTNEMKNEILNAGHNATARSYAFDDVARTRFWPEGIDGRAISNDILVDFEQGLDLDARLKKFDQAKEKGERSRMVVWAGAGIGLVNDKRDAAVSVPSQGVVRLSERSLKAIVKEVHDELVYTLQAVSSMISI